MRPTSVAAMGTSAGRKNIDGETKFAIVNIVRIGMRQNKVANDFSISKILKQSKESSSCV